MTHLPMVYISLSRRTP